MDALAAKPVSEPHDPMSIFGQFLEGGDSQIIDL